MGISSFMGIETALRGILAQQQALDITAHNIGNAGTVGYTRQKADLQTTAPFDTGKGLLGTGVDVSSYQRVRDSFLDIQLRAQTMRSGYADARQSALTQVEGSLAEPGNNGLNTLINRYWSSWQDVANAPENTATRQALVQNASSLAAGFSSVAAQIGVISSQTGLAIADTLGQVNSIGDKIAKLSTSIVNQKAVGNTSNDLLDQRDVLIDQLSKLGNISWTDQPSGAVDVTVGGGALVTGVTATTLVEADLTSLTSGKLAALVELRDTTLPGYLTSLNAVAKQLADKVNAQHALGYDIATGAAGAAFFTYTGGSEAATLAVSGAIAANPLLIATSDTLPGSATGRAGNSGNAIAIAGLRGDAAIDVAYVRLVNKIGADSQESTRELDNASTLTSALENRRQSVSGVSLDEEMTNLIKFQRGFQASSRALNVMDDMLELLITRTGRAGL
jgi:flagellar hook-associated protein 1 FlgK